MRRPVPFIPKPEHKEVADTEQLVKVPLRHDARPQEVKQPHFIKIPHYNDLYDSFGTKQGWRYACDDFVQGTMTTVAGTAVLSSVALSSPSSMSPKFKLGTWPGGVQVFLVVRYFSFGPSSASIVNQGAINALFIDQFGNTLPLGVLPNNGFSSFFTTAIMPSPITDSANINVGSLSFTLSTGATTASYAWQLGFSFAYLLPAKKGFSWEALQGH